MAGRYFFHEMAFSDHHLPHQWRLLFALQSTRGSPQTAAGSSRNGAPADPAGTSERARRSCNVDQQRIIAVGLLTQGDLALLGPTFTRVWPVDEAPCFNGLLRAIDEADRELRRSRAQSNKTNGRGPSASG
jgi:hypothetical protein